MKTPARGVTLIELMLSQLLGLVMISGALALFAPGVTLFEQTSGAALVQETGRLAVETMARDIQQSGFRGCARERQRLSVIDPESAIISRRLKAWAFESLRVGGIDADNVSEIDRLLGSGWNSKRFRQGDFRFGDLLMVQSVRPGDLEVVSHDAGDELLAFAGDQRTLLTRGMVIGISDCHQSTILQLERGSAPHYNQRDNTTVVRYGSGGSANCAAPSSPGGQQVWLGGTSQAGCPSAESRSGLENYQFASGSQGFLLSSRLYYLSVQDNTDYPSLYRTEMASDGARLNTEIIAEGVENMRLRFGLDENADGTPDRYVAAVSVGDADDAAWGDVVSVKLWILVSTVDQRGYSRFIHPVLFPDQKGATQTCIPHAGDASSACPLPGAASVLRRVFTREVMLRNPGL